MKILKKKKHIQVNNGGFTLTEMIVAFMLLAIFMVAATRVISYTVNIYHAAKGASNGMEVSEMISRKVVGMLEGATGPRSADVAVVAGSTGIAGPVVTHGSEGDSIAFADATDSDVTISVTDGVINIRYDAVEGESEEEGNLYEAVDWKFDKEAYMDYRVVEFGFESAGSDYPDNVLVLNMVIESPKYGSYPTKYYIKCPKIDYITGL